MTDIIIKSFGKITEEDGMIKFENFVIDTKYSTYTFNDIILAIIKRIKESMK